MASYGESLAALMEAQFPALHNPLDERHQIALPTLGRSFYSVQQQAVQVGIKLLAQGANPFVISEVGTGKTTMALAMAAALSPQYVDGTMGELARVGIASDRLRPISHVVVMCPPHLLETWQDELRAVLPGARAVAVERFADLDQAPRAAGSAPGAGMTFYILSRERAKLGSGLRAGVWLLSGERRCPTCGGAVEAADTTLVSGRARCKQLDARPTNGAAEVARDLAALLAPLYPLNDTVAALAQGRIQVRARARLADRLAAAARERGDPDTPLRHAEQLWGSPERRFWRARLLRRLAAEAAALIDKSHEHERTTHTLGALVTLAAALPDAERAPLAEEGRRGATMEAPADLLPDVAAHLYAATAADTTVYGNGARVRRTVCELLLLWDGPETPLERAHRDDADDAWSTFRRVRARLSRERAAATGRRSTHGPDASEMVGRWSDYTVDEEGRLQLGDLPVGAPETAAAALDRLMRVAQFAHDEPCGEFLYQATPAPRRYPLARHLVRRRRGLVDLVILDEVQELGHAGTAQEKAGHRLVQLPGAAVISLSGSIMNGYASTLFPNYWALSARFRRDYARDEKQRFIDRFGYRKRLVLRGDGHQPVATVAAYGAMSDREELIEDPAVRQLGEAPGLLPLFVLRYLLPEAVLVHKSELDLELPPFLERPVYVTFSESAADTALRGGYTGLKDRLVAQVQEDRGTGLAGKLWGALSEMPSYLDLGTADTGNCRVAGTPRYRACYPRDCGGSVVHEAPLISSLALTPKERWLVATLRAELAEGRNVLVFVRHTKGSGLPKRLQRLIVRELGEPAAFLDADKVGTDRRQAWISSETVATGRRVLIVNPNAIKTGLNNLVFASTAIWLELDHSAITYRQANGRLHRIGQMNEVRIYYPVYQDTAQEIARDLLAAKVTASLQADGLELRSTLEALGASGEEDATTLAMSIGQGIYQRLTRGYVPDRLSRRADAVVASARRAFAVPPLPLLPPLPPLPLLQPRTLPPGGAASVPIADAPEGLILTPLPVRALPVLDLGSVEPLPPGRDAERPAHCALQRLPEVPHDRQLSFLDLFADGDEARPAS